MYGPSLTGRESWLLFIVNVVINVVVVADAVVFDFIILVYPIAYLHYSLELDDSLRRI